ncbi:MAG: hypothetical protein KKD94_01580 [Nanoarchaeota archaeon]|nr:hypothetical protein [Nanoarchaeota archaeon]
MGKAKDTGLDEFRENYAPRLREAFNSNIKLVEGLIRASSNPKQTKEYLADTERLIQDLADKRLMGFYYGAPQDARPEVAYGNYETFGEAIKDFRAQSGMQINTLSLTAQVSSRTIVDLEKGRKSIGDCRNGVKERLSNAFSVQPIEKLDDLHELD